VARDVEELEVSAAANKPPTHNYSEVLMGVTYHPGFKKASEEIQKKEGLSEKAAGAILANSARNASAAAKKANSNLKKVK
jgi:hypothetical protein